LEDASSQEGAGRLRLTQLREEFRKKSQAPFVPDLDRVGWIFQAYVGNAQELMRHIRNPHPDFFLALETRAPGDQPEIYRQFTAELYRLLLNYVASTSTLIDYIRVLEGKLKDANPEVHRQILQGRKPISESDIAHFVKTMRNLMIHRDLPATRGTTSWNQHDNQIRFDTTLPISVLLERDGWYRGSKEFMNGKDQISLADTILQYDSMVQDLYGWIFRALEQVTTENAIKKINLEMEIGSLKRKLGVSCT